MSAVKRWSRFAFNVVMWVFAACCAVQVYLAGLGVFASGANFATHRDFGYVFGLLTLVLIVLAILARVSRGVIVATMLLLVLFGLQSVFILLWKSSPPNPTLAALHPLNGFVILAVAVWVGWVTRGYLRAPRRAEPVATIASETQSA